MRTLKTVELAVIGAGPAGASAALSAASCGVRVLLVDRAAVPGGQLIKQTHKFFGWKEKFAGTRGIMIAEKLASEISESGNIEFWPESEALGYYKDGTLMVETRGRVELVRPQKLLVAAGASERMLLFPGNDLPGVYGAGAVQTLMNVYGVRPGKSVLMVGSGNIGLIVSYQLAQAGVHVEAVVEALPQIGGYLVHASKIRRLGIPILTRHSVKEVIGSSSVERAVIWQIDENWQGIPGTEKEINVDVVCLAVGLTPLTDILWQAGAEMRYIPELGGFVPLCDENLETTVPGVYCAGDALGIEEASTAMLEGELAGLSCAKSLGKMSEEEFLARRDEIKRLLLGLRKGPTGEKVRKGYERMRAYLSEAKKEVCGA